MKKIAFALTVFLIFSLVSCGGRKQTVRVEINNEEKPTVVDVSELDVIGGADDTEINYLDDIEGFWVQSKDYEPDENDALVSVTEMLVVSRELSWTPYFDGVAGQPLKCSADLDGLHLCGVEGDLLISLTYNGETLTDNDGKVLYERTMTVEERIEAERIALENG